MSFLAFDLEALPEFLGHTPAVFANPESPDEQSALLPDVRDNHDDPDTNSWNRLGSRGRVQLQDIAELVRSGFTIPKAVQVLNMAGTRVNPISFRFEGTLPFRYMYF